jgi:nucleoside-diphosphate-sugar epimerase
MTGASGFVGTALRARLGAEAVAIRLGGADWDARIRAAALRDATVFHLAARAHATSRDAEALLMRDNVEKTRVLAEVAARAGARRLVFVSSIKVNGEETAGRPFDDRDLPSPQDAYGLSKWHAEQALAAVAGRGALEVVVVRAPLVYGPGVKGNLLSLLRLADSPCPLPFAALDNRRSFVHVDDLARLLVECGAQPRAAGGLFLAAHPDSVSTSRLVARMRDVLARPRRLWRMRASLLESLAAPLGLGSVARRLTRSLEVDAGAARRLLGWEAIIGFDAAVEDMVRAHRDSAA